ncbi:hypothetical protein QBC37DRAFT_395258 [Rhypophila decipiens]|uniref:Uncharacterized protein n=1 Tax=Rhypophila decipiens TaxID=261697 RepID=A0AAN6YJA8_9PEZI|nr:hypothetical protein QBC37DRAFT_395258 [Rhypophila decipiens]
MARSYLIKSFLHHTICNSVPHEMGQTGYVRLYRKEAEDQPPKAVEKTVQEIKIKKQGLRLDAPSALFKRKRGVKPGRLSVAFRKTVYIQCRLMCILPRSTTSLKKQECSHHITEDFQYKERYLRAYRHDSDTRYMCTDKCRSKQSSSACPGLHGGRASKQASISTENHENFKQARGQKSDSLIKVLCTEWCHLALNSPKREIISSLSRPKEQHQHHRVPDERAMVPKSDD